MTETQDWVGGIAVVTGCSTGIGLATAVELARAGYRTYATMRDLSKSEALTAIVGRESLPVSTVQLDVDDDGSVAHAFNHIFGESGRVDVLVNNAGIAELGAVEDQSIDAFKRTMETNFFGVVRCIKAVLPSMRVARRGCIVNISSPAGRVVFGGIASYAASKHALEAMSEALAQEVKSLGLRVFLIEPGVVDTEQPKYLTQRNSPPSLYPHEARFHQAVKTALDAQPISPFVVSQRVRHIVESDTEPLRHVIGDRVKAILELRASLTDEAWIELNA